MSAPRQPKTDEKIIDDFIRFENNTHKEELSNSVGIVILKLMKTYLEEAPSQEAKEAICRESCKELALLMEDAQYAVYKPALNSMFKRMQEQVNVLDTVTLFLPTEEGEYKEFVRVFPLNEVLPLVWCAMKDHQKYAHNYEGTPAQQRAQAAEDYEERLKCFFHYLERLYAGICHHGVRNDLVCLLNKTYDDVDIIEDMDAVISLYLKDKLIERVLPKLGALDEEDLERQLVVDGLVTWMSESSVVHLANILGCKEKIIDELKQLTLDHGSNPEKFQIAERAEAALTGLPFHCDPKNLAVFYQANAIINEIAMPQQTERNAAVKTMQAQLKYGCRFNLDDAYIIARVYAAISAYEDLSRNKHVLVISGQMTETQIDQLSAKLIVIFNQLRAGIDKANASAVDLDELNLFNDAVLIAKKNSFSDLIENFFVHWYGSDHEKLRLYGYLLDENITKKIILTDSDIKKFIAEADSNNILRVSPYLINRIFLHAILVLPGQWTNLFEVFFKLKVLPFVESKFNNDTFGLVADGLMKASYSNVLLAQLRYLVGKREGKAAKENPSPKNRLVLPSHARTLVDWCLVLSNVSKSKWPEVCLSHAVLFRVAINSHMLTHNLKMIDIMIWALKPRVDLRINWFAILDAQQMQQLVDSINDTKDLLVCLRLFPTEKYQEFIELLGSKVRKIMERKIESLAATDDKNQPLLQPAQISAWISALSPWLKDFMGFRDFFDCKKELPVECTITLIEELGGELANIFKKPGQLNSCLSSSDMLNKYYEVDAKLMIALGAQGVSLLRQISASNFAWFYDTTGKVDKLSVELLYAYLERIFKHYNHDIKDMFHELLRLQFDKINDQRNNANKELFIEARESALDWVLCTAKGFASSVEPKALMMLDVAYHHELFSEPKSRTKAKLISGINSAFALFSKENEGHTGFIESGSQLKLRVLKEEIELKNKGTIKLTIQPH